MTIQVGKWGNGLGVRIPGSMAKELGLSEGSELDLHEDSGSLILRPVAKPVAKYVLEEMLAAITPEMIHAETDWGPAQGNEIW